MDADLTGSGSGRPCWLWGFICNNLFHSTSPTIKKVWYHLSHRLILYRLTPTENTQSGSMHYLWWLSIIYYEITIDVGYAKQHFHITHPALFFILTVMRKQDLAGYLSVNVFGQCMLEHVIQTFLLLLLCYGCSQNNQIDGWWYNGTVSSQSLMYSNFNKPKLFFSARSGCQYLVSFKMLTDVIGENLRKCWNQMKALPINMSSEYGSKYR